MLDIARLAVDSKSRETLCAGAEGDKASALRKAALLSQLQAVQGGPAKEKVPSSLFLLSSDNLLRKTANAIIDWP